jgi:hypothetical protein
MTMIKVINYPEMIEIIYDSNVLFINASPSYDVVVEDILKGISDMKEAIMSDKKYCFNACEDRNLQRLPGGEFAFTFEDDRCSLVIGNWLNNIALWNLFQDLVTDDKCGTYLVDGDKVIRE